MGHDIVPTGRHSLNTTDIYSLAADLAQRLNANIKFGYADSFVCDNVAEMAEPSYKTVHLGEITIPGATGTYYLSDDHFQLKACYQRLGEHIFCLPCVKDSPTTIAQLQDKNFYQSYTFYNSATQDEEFGYIYNDIICCHAYYYSRWWTFCRVFTTENNFDEDFKGIQQYRMELKLFLKKLGGHEMVYIDDQGESARFTGENHEWADITKAMETDYAGKVLNLSEFMQDKTIRQAGDYPVIFYDNFADLN